MLERNLKALRTRNPELLVWLERSAGWPRAEVRPSLGGHPNLFLEDPEGRMRPVHDLRDPLAQEIGLWEFDRPRGDRVVVIFGAGLGYPYLAFRQATGLTDPVVLIEPNPLVVRAMLSAHDFSADLLSERLVLLTPTLDLRAQDVLYRLLVGEGRQSLLYCRLHVRSAMIRPEYRPRYEKAVQEISAIGSDVHQHIAGDAMITFQTNPLFNIPRLIHGPAEAGLAGLLAGRPAVVVCTGPTLRHDLAALGEVAGRAVVIAVAPAVRLLLAAGIKVDLAVTLDAWEDQRQVFEDLYPWAGEIPLLAGAQTFSEVVRTYQGPTAVQPYQPYVATLAPAYPRAASHPGVSVGEQALAAALFLGCDPVICLGLDLAYGAETYAPGTKDRIGTSRANFWARDKQGRMISTSTTMQVYRATIEALAKRSEATLINVSPTGARVEGMADLDFESARERWLTEEFDAGPAICAALAERPAPAEGLVSTLNGLAQRLESMLGRLRQSVRAMPSRVVVQGRVDEGRLKKVNRVLEAVGRIRDYGLAENPALAELILGLFARFNRPLPPGATGPDEVAERVRRLTELAREVDPVVDRFAAVLAGIAAEMAELEAALVEGRARPEDAAVHARLGRRLLAAGLRDSARRELTRAVDLDPGEVEARLDLAGMDLQLLDLAAAEKRLAEVRALSPDNVRAADLETKIAELRRELPAAALAARRERDWVQLYLEAEKCRRAGIPGADWPAEAATARAAYLDQLALAGPAPVTRGADGEAPPAEAPPAEMAAGQALFGRGDFAGARAAFERAVQLDPRRPEAAFMCALCRMMTGDLAGAEALLADLVAAHPLIAAYRCELGRVNILAGRDRDGLDQVHRGMTLAPQAGGVLLDLARHFHATGDTPRAITMLEHYLYFWPDDPRALEFLAGLFEAWGKADEADQARRAARLV